MHRLHLTPSATLVFLIGCAALMEAPARSPAPVSASTVRAQAMANVPAVLLSWPGLAAGPDGYIIERSREEGGFIEIARVDAKTTSYRDVGLVAGTRYAYRVRPSNAARAAGHVAGATTADFHVYDCTYFKGKPDLKRLGIEDINVVAGSFFYLLDKPGGGYDWTRPNEAATRQVARRAADLGQILCIDIEHLPEDIRRQKPAEVHNTIRMYHQIVDWIRSERPEVKIGFYASFPRREYWDVVLHQQAIEKRKQGSWDRRLPEYEAKHRAWQAANDLFKPLAEKVDYVFPSLYTFYDKPADWVYYAKGNILEAKRFGKPVIPFLWMDYHDSTPLIGQRLSAEFWQLQLQTVRQMADGVVIWGGMHASPTTRPVAEDWSESDAWWRVTREFVTAPGLD